MQIELTQQELEFLTHDLDIRLKKCNPTGYPMTNSTQLPKKHADFYNTLYRKLTNQDHSEYIKYRETLK